jgi:DNA mismatch endonuclease (patch repair protein)
MARIKSKGNASTELALARVLRRNGITGWRRQRKVMGISVDFVFNKSKIAVFTDGCFWHGCIFHVSVRDLKPYWSDKIAGNVMRDERQEQLLEHAGWQVIRIWEHELKGDSDEWIVSVIRCAVSRRRA